jgi:hypothetical protein
MLTALLIFSMIVALNLAALLSGRNAGSGDDGHRHVSW